MTSPWIVDALRTPVGRHRGALAGVRPDDLAAQVVGAIVARTGADPNAVDDVYLGCTNGVGEDSRNVARMAVLLAGLPDSVPGATVNRLCGSGMEAVVAASRAVRCGEGRLLIAGGVESMSRAPWALRKPDRALPWGDAELADTTIGWRFVNARMPDRATVSMGETAENVAERHGVSRVDQDAFALRSHERAVAAERAGRLRGEMVGVEVRRGRHEVATVDSDESPRPDSTPESLARLRPAFREGGSVTAGNSSSINDGAAALLIADDDAAGALDRTPLARVVAAATAGVAPELMGMGPVPASLLALERAGLTIADIGLVELNEAFASQAIACVRQLGLDPELVNVNGGAIALGHPLGMSGARIVGTLAHEMRRREVRYGLATMCIGVGQGIAVVLENPAV
ncbi:3-oxoadipyl-CoA/3-oxo-5,6-dehydrosuberyl-CoA thiolase [Baekduia alba]|uniref:thiolase family protein n=1 Tax=Baekduia alba TaxID=2997333 RepID=UPI0023402BF8|nr:acetyl-CoA C-acyltransferase [Baekduia alba]WCB93361.1 3-oxoadipyl-CoA/3-oxo-5,6-dehydrosuberyl-CoA thiolase [Baekduia alba]